MKDVPENKKAQLPQRATGLHLIPTTINGYKLRQKNSNQHKDADVRKTGSFSMRHRREEGRNFPLFFNPSRGQKRVFPYS